MEWFLFTKNMDFWLPVLYVFAIEALKNNKNYRKISWLAHSCKSLG